MNIGIATSIYFYSRPPLCIATIIAILMAATVAIIIGMVASKIVL